MKGKKPPNKLKVQPPECRVCGLQSKAEGQFCTSCEATHQELVALAVKRSLVIRYAPLYFYEAICLYQNWLRENKWLRVLRRARVIAEWLDKNKHNKTRRRRYQELHLLFVEFVSSFLTSHAEKKLEEMEEIFELLEKR